MYAIRRKTSASTSAPVSLPHPLHILTAGLLMHQLHSPIDISIVQRIYCKLSKCVSVSTTDKYFMEKSKARLYTDTPTLVFQKIRTFLRKATNSMSLCLSNRKVQRTLRSINYYITSSDHNAQFGSLFLVHQIFRSR